MLYKVYFLVHFFTHIMVGATTRPCHGLIINGHDWMIGERTTYNDVELSMDDGMLCEGPPTASVDYNYG